MRCRAVRVCAAWRGVAWGVWARAGRGLADVARALVLFFQCTLPFRAL